MDQERAVVMHRNAYSASSSSSTSSSGSVDSQKHANLGLWSSGGQSSMDRQLATEGPCDAAKTEHVPVSPSVRLNQGRTSARDAGLPSLNGLNFDLNLSHVDHGGETFQLAPSLGFSAADPEPCFLSLEPEQNVLSADRIFLPPEHAPFPDTYACLAGSSLQASNVRREESSQLLVNAPDPNHHLGKRNAPESGFDLSSSSGSSRMALQEQTTLPTTRASFNGALHPPAENFPGYARSDQHSGTNFLTVESYHRRNVRSRVGTSERDTSSGTLLSGYQPINQLPTFNPVMRQLADHRLSNAANSSSVPIIARSLQRISHDINSVSRTFTARDISAGESSVPEEPRTFPNRNHFDIPLLVPATAATAPNSDCPHLAGENENTNDNSRFRVPEAANPTDFEQLLSRILPHVNNTAPEGRNLPGFIHSTPLSASRRLRWSPSVGFQHQGNPNASLEIRSQQTESVGNVRRQASFRQPVSFGRHGRSALDVPSYMRTLTNARDGRSRMVTEILLDFLQQDRNARFQSLLDRSVLLARFNVHDRHRDMRLDVDNMSYEELLDLEERIGNVSTGLSDENMESCLKQWKYGSASSTAATDVEPCCICQEEYVDGDDVATLGCRHDFHAACIKQWLMQKNLCPICKKAAHSS